MTTNFRKYPQILLGNKIDCDAFAEDGPCREVRWLEPPPFRIPPEHQCTHLVCIGNDSAPKGWYWTSSLCFRGRHREKQRVQKQRITNSTPPPSSSTDPSRNISTHEAHSMLCPSIQRVGLAALSGFFPLGRQKQ